MTDLLEQLEQRTHRVDRGDPRAIFRAAMSEADEVRSLALVEDTGRPGPRRTQRIALGTLVACVVLVAVGVVWFVDREPSPPVADAFPAADVRFGPFAPPEGYELSTVRFAMYGPPPDVRLMTTVYAPDDEASSSLTVLVRRGVEFTPDGMMPDGATSEVIGGQEVRLADGDRFGSRAVIAGWDRQDGSRVFVVGRGVTLDEVKASIPGLVVDRDDRASLAAVPEGFQRRFTGDGTDSAFAFTGSTPVMLLYAPTDGSERQLSVRTVPGARFEPIAVRWLDPSVEATMLPDGTSAFLVSDGRGWVKQLPDGLAVIHAYQVGNDVEVPSVVAGTRSLTPTEWDEVTAGAEVIHGLDTTGNETEAGPATAPAWRTEPGP